MLLKFVREQTEKDWNWKLIYRASEHGFEKVDFYEYCQDKENTVVIVHNEEDQVFGGYTPCKWEYVYNLKFGTDETLTTFIFILRTCAGFNHEPRLFKLKKERMHKALSYRNNTAFDFGCNDFFFFQRNIHTLLKKCCYEWYEASDDDIFLGGKRSKSTPKEIEIYQLSNECTHRNLYNLHL